MLFFVVHHRPNIGQIPTFIGMQYRPSSWFILNCKQNKNINPIKLVNKDINPLLAELSSYQQLIENMSWREDLA